MKHQFNKPLAVIALLAILATSFTANYAEAAQISSVNDKISNSGPSVVATHTISLTTHYSLIAGDYYSVILPSGFGSILVGNITCPASTTASVLTPDEARCDVTAPISAGTSTIVIANVTNPASVGINTILITTRHSNDVVIENADVKVAIINGVAVSASVAAILSFEIRPLATSTAVNGTVTTIASATSSMAYGMLTAGVSAIMGQELRVSTNATEGYSVTIQQNQDLLNGMADINAFRDGLASTTALTWSAPSAILDATTTYGHFGFTSEDATLFDGDVFGNNLWRGFPSTSPVEVMYHNGPADGAYPDKGYTKVAYQVEISSLQEPGDYTNTITYIATPTY
ncbi:MAG: hypothetical protein WCK11_03850 [Candidatus Falkowbacteria bacterium]